jgi:acetyltransferase-like isoleucine patch superfamily enzyme
MPRTLPWDWYSGVVPDNVVLEDSSYLETSQSFQLFRSREQVGLRLGAGSAAYTGAMFDVGPAGSIEIGRYALINPVWFICDSRIEIGDYTLISWNVVLMDSYREPFDPELRRRYRDQVLSGRRPPTAPAHPIRIGANVWIGFDSCILPGVTIGDGSIVGARSVVTESIPPYSIAAGNPARIVRRIDPEEHSHDSATAS